MRRDQREPSVERLAELGQRRGAQAYAQQQCKGAECAEPAIAHDGELGFAVTAAAKSVDGVGEAVLVKRAGQQETGQHGQERPRPVAEAEELCREEDKGPDRADTGPDERKGPGRGREPSVRVRCDGYRDPG